jgi:spermidine/putrescine-binding protein
VKKGKRLKFSIHRMAVLALGCALVLNACGDRKPPHSGTAPGPTPGSAASGKVLNLYIWSDYLAADTLPNFE